MTASEIIEQIKTLPKEEQNEVFAFVRKVDRTSVKSEGSLSLDVAQFFRDTEGDTPASEVRFAQDEAFEIAAARVFETHDELFKRLAK